MTVHILPHHVHALGSQIPQAPGEPDDAYIMLLTWVGLGQPPTSELAAIATDGTDADTIDSWRRTYQWQRRLDDSPAAHQADRVRRRLEYTIRTLTEGDDRLSARILKLIRNTVSKITVADAMTDAPIVGLRDLGALLKTVHDYERLEANQSTENVAHAYPQLDAAQLDALTPDELMLAKKILPTLGSGT